MTVQSLGPSKLQSILKEVRGFRVGSDVDELDPNDYFALARFASELSLYGPGITEALADDWENLDAAQRLLTVMLAEKAPADAITSKLENCTRPDNSYYLRIGATAALGSANPATAAPVLKALADDELDGVRKEAVKALGAMDGIADLELLEKGISDEDAGVRRETVDALAKISGQRAAILLLATLDDPQMGVALAAKKHLLARKDERDLVLDMVGRLKDFGTKGRYRLPYAVEILARLNDARAISPMLEHLETCRNNEVKKAIGKALAKHKNPAILPALWRLAEDEHEKVQVEGLKLLKRHPHVDSVPALRRIVDKIHRKGDCPVIVSAPLIDAIAAIPGNDSAALLLDCAVSPEYRLIDDAVPALKKRKIDVPIKRLRQRLQDEDSDYFREKFRKAYATLVSADQLDAAPAGDEPPSGGPVEKQESTFERMQRLQREIAGMSDDEVIAYARSEADYRDIDSSAFEKLQKIDTAESSLQLRRFLKSQNLYERYAAARALDSRGLELSDADRLVLRICSPGNQDASLDEFQDIIGSVLADVVVDQSNCTENMISTLWASGHPHRVPFAIRWLGYNLNGKNLGKVAFDCLKSDRAACEADVLETFTNPPKFGKPDAKQLAILLGRFKCDEAVDPLIARLTDPDVSESEQQHYVEALGFIGDERATPLLIELLPEVQEGPLLRRVIEALVRLGAKEAVPAIENREIRNPKLEPVREKALAKLTG